MFLYSNKLGQLQMGKQHCTLSYVAQKKTILQYVTVQSNIQTALFVIAGRN